MMTLFSSMNSLQSLGLYFGLYYVFMYLFSPLIHSNNKNDGDNNNNKDNIITQQLPFIE